LSLAADKATPNLAVYAHAGPRTPRPMVPGAAELAAHAEFVGRLKDPLWLQP
jgi:DNA polymerase III subunit epsilon